VIIKLLRLLFGYIEFQATDGFPERFLNLCNINGITLWNVQNDGVKVEACTPIKAYKNIRKPAHKSGMKVKIIRKRGLPFFAKYNKARVGVLVGGVVSVVLLFLSSCVLWDVEVTGNTKIKNEELLESLSGYNVKVGSVKSKIDTKSVESQLLKDYPELSWASINIFGMKAVLEVKENKEMPEIIDENIPMNIVAKKDGRIISVNGYSGTNVVKENDVVLRGDLLISGVKISQDGSERTIRAKGKVFAETTTNLTAEVSGAQELKAVNEMGIRYKLYVLGAEIPVRVKCKGKELYNGKKLLKGDSTMLPLGVAWDVSYLFTNQNIELTEEQTGLLSLLEVVEKKRNEFLSECEILKSEYEKKTTETGILIENKIVAKENIALEKEIFVE
jgi:similar to stage IV sporulation protein